MNRISASAAPLMYVLALSALPALAVPFGSANDSLEKGMIAAFVLGAGLCLSGLALFLSRAALPLVRNGAFLAGLGLLVVAVISAARAGPSEMSFFGLGFEVGTVGSIALFAFAVAAPAFLSERIARFFPRVFVFAVLLSGVYAFVRAVAGSSSDEGGTLAASSAHLALLSAGALAVALFLADHEKDARLRLCFSACAIVLAIVLFSFFELTAVLVLLFALAVLLFALAARSSMFRDGRVPLNIILGIIVLVLLVSFGSRTPFFASATETRPTLLLTEIVAMSALSDNIGNVLIGTGPRSFSAAWERYRPVELNATPLWHLSPSSGWSTAATFAVTLGGMGAIALLIAFVPLLRAIGAMMERASSENERAPLGAFFIMALFSFVAILAYPVDPALFLIGGCAIGFAVRASSATQLFAPVALNLPLRLLGALVCILLGAALLWISVAQFVAASAHARGVSLLAEGRVEEAVILLEHGAAAFWPVSLYERDAARAVLEAAFKSAAVAEPTAVQANVERAITLANRATDSDPKDYAAWLSQGSLHVSLVGAGAVQYEEKARAALEQAHQLAPQRPESLYLLAELALRLGKTEEARAYAQQALALKADYAEAQELITRLQRTSSTVQ